MDQPIRPRRLRSNTAMRRLVSEVAIEPAHLVLPIFVAESQAPIASMPGVVKHELAGAAQIARRAADAGVGGIMIFGVPDEADKDEQGSAGWASDGITQRAISSVIDAVGEQTVVMVDTCLDEFTSHGHCGVLDDQGRVLNDASVELYVNMALAQAQAGAHVVSPSGMMDGQVAAIRAGLDHAGYQDVAIMAYGAKYASAFYGPFREAVSSTLRGDRKTYQQDPANRREGLREALLDVDEGADMVMVKPAGYYLDVLADVTAVSPIPVAAYQVSGEYAMVEAAAANGWLDRSRAVTESVTAIFRAGADVVLTYWALEIAEALA